MIRSNVSSSVQIVVENQTTGTGVEMRFKIPIGFLRDFAPATLLTGVAWVDGFHDDSQFLRLGFQESSEFGETPIGGLPIQISAPILLDLLEVFDDDSANVFAVGQDGLHRTVEDVIPEAVLSASQRFQASSTRRCALGLEFSTAKSHLRRAMVEVPASDEFSTGGHGDVTDALIDADRPAILSDRWCVLGGTDIQEPISTLSLDESGTTDLPRSIEELDLVGGECIINPNSISQCREGAVVRSDSRSADVEGDGGAGELGFGLRTSFSTGPSSSRCERTTDESDGRDDVIGFQSGVFPSEVVIAECLDGGG
jgi:hypothetical protein